MSLTHFSLFSGIGGLDLAAEWAGFETIGEVEIDNYATKVLEKNFQNVKRWSDIRDVQANDIFSRTGEKEITVLSGGFPCQPHSLSGRRLASNDERDLWDEYYRLICEINPRWIVAENVRGLLSSENGRFFGRVLRDVSQCGYNAWWWCFPGAYCGAAFVGERVAIVAASSRVRGNSVDKNKPPEPDKKYLENMEKWTARSNNILLGITREIGERNSGRPRNDHGIPEALDRFKCLGNSVVPQQFYPIFATIAHIERNCENGKREKF